MYIRFTPLAFLHYTLPRNILQVNIFRILSDAYTQLERCVSISYFGRSTASFRSASSRGSRHCPRFLLVAMHSP